VPTLEQRINDCLVPVFHVLESGSDPVLRPSEHADFQVNGVMGLAKRLGVKPREVAERIVNEVDFAGLIETVEIAGPGFLNLTVSERAFVEQLEMIASDEHLGVPNATAPEVVVVDYSAPNVAKEMHVGHLRSTVIGDSLCRMLEFTGNRVIRRNHIGDWGTPFGMLIEHLIDQGEDAAVANLSMGDLDGFYREARTKFDADDVFRDRSRQRVVLLQGGDAETLRLWGILVQESIQYFGAVYQELGITLSEADVVGESSYNDMLDDVVADLDAKGLLVDSDGALCVFPEGFVNRDGEPLPVIVRKSDEGYGYAATDLAAIRDRVSNLSADRLLYVVGSPQAQHFAMCFAVATMAGWLNDQVVAEHVAFGNVLGPDRKMFKTREGGTVKLKVLLDEGSERARAALAERASNDGDRDHIAHQLAMGAIKYADLSTDRQRDYVFDWDRMLAFEGDTGPYLQYAHARICSIFRRGDDLPVGGPIILGEPAERALALQLTGFADAVASALEVLSPAKLCTYLFELAQSFTSFYESCPVLKAPDRTIMASRLTLCRLTASTLQVGLDLLGIEAPEQM
jgi:arginyl-tRNA synthetase